MKLEIDNETLAEKQALILYIVDKVSKPIGNEALLNLAISIDNMNYFYFQQLLLELLENKYVINYEKDGENLYKLTKEGKQALKLVKDIIPGIIKFKIDSTFKDTLNNFEEKISITSDFIPHSENEYSVKCKIAERNQVLFELQLYAGSREQAKSITDNWEKNAEELYPKIIDVLTKKSD